MPSLMRIALLDRLLTQTPHYAMRPLFSIADNLQHVTRSALAAAIQSELRSVEHRSSAIHAAV
jgi:hypothetical protein